MREYIREIGLNIILIISLTLNILAFVKLVKGDDIQSTTIMTTIADETTTYAPTEEITTCEPAKTGEIAFDEVGMAAVIKETKIYSCKWADIILNEDELKLLYTTVYCEAGNQDLETQYMVALTVLNRLQAGYADDLRGVIYAPRAYAVTKWSNFEDRGWTEQVEQAVDMALEENRHPRDMYYFRTDYYHKFAENYKKSNDLYFSTQKGV